MKEPSTCASLVRPGSEALAYKVLGEEEQARQLLIDLRDRILQGTTRRNLHMSFASQLGLVYAALGEEAASMDAFTQSRLLVRDVENPRTLSSIEINRALALAWLGKKDEAVAEFERLIKETQHAPPAPHAPVPGLLAVAGSSRLPSHLGRSGK